MTGTLFTISNITFIVALMTGLCVVLYQQVAAAARCYKRKEFKDVMGNAALGLLVLGVLFLCLTAISILLESK